MFLSDCIDKKLKVYSYPAVIAYLQDERESTWFKGYNEKYFFDKGVLFSVLFPGMCRIFTLVHCIKHRKKYSEYGVINAYKQMLKGINLRKKVL